jgi:hypothetical protein
MDQELANEAGAAVSCWTAASAALVGGLDRRCVAVARSSLGVRSRLNEPRRDAEARCHHAGLASDMNSILWPDLMSFRGRRGDLVKVLSDGGSDRGREADHPGRSRPKAGWTFCGGLWGEVSEQNCFLIAGASHMRSCSRFGLPLRPHSAPTETAVTFHRGPVHSVVSADQRMQLAPPLQLGVLTVPRRRVPAVAPSSPAAAPGAAERV